MGLRGKDRFISRVVTVSLVAFVIVGLGALPAGARARGTYLIEQVSTLAELEQAAPQIEAALDLPGVLGFSIRVPWSSLEPTQGDYDFEILRRARQIAGTDRLAIRFMAGKHTPSWWRGNTMVYDGATTGGMGAGSLIPLPFSDSGGPNYTFEEGWTALADRLAAWSWSNYVSVLHMSWPGLLWAELALTNQMMNERGYSYQATLATHLRLLDYGIEKSTYRTSVEFPMTGYSPSELRSDIISHLLDSPEQARVILQTNFMTDNHAGLPFGDSPPPRWAAQMVDQSNDYYWPQVYDNASEMYAEYVEVYTESFSGGTSARLRMEAAAFYRDSLPWESLSRRV